AFRLRPGRTAGHDPALFNRRTADARTHESRDACDGRSIAAPLTMAENLQVIRSKPRVVSRMRPTGKLHLGNYVGALANCVRLQDTHDCYFFIADWHALTTDYADTSE